MYQRRTISIRRVVKLLQGAARSGVSIPDLLDQCGIPRKLLDDPTATVERDTLIHLMLLIMQQTQDEFLGFGQGRKSKPGTFSMMAHAVINCPNLGAAIERGIRFYDLFELSMSTRVERDGETALLVVEADERLDFREIIIEASLFIWLRFMSWLVGKAIEPTEVMLDYADNQEGEAQRFLLDCPIHYQQPRNQIRFRADVLDLPLVQNELSLSRFLKDTLKQLFTGDLHNVGLPAQIRGIISEQYGNSFPDFSEICSRLEMTPQTLRRRLKEANTSYQEIKDAIRKDASVYYLSKPELSIDEIALLMGFSEASSFHRAFKKWTGKTPSSFRKEHFGSSQ